LGSIQLLLIQISNLNHPRQKKLEVGAGLETGEKDLQGKEDPRTEIDRIVLEGKERIGEGEGKALEEGEGGRGKMVKEGKDHLEDARL